MKKFKALYKKYGWVRRFLLILIIALWLNFFIFSSRKIHSNELEKINIEENKTYLNLKSIFDLSEEDLKSGDINSVLWRLFSKRAGRDKICFEEKGSYFKQSNKTEKLIPSVSFNEGAYFILKDKKCFDIPKEQDKITFAWR